MLFFYIRHGERDGFPAKLTPLGERQAEAVAKRMALYGVDKIYSSTATRAIQTAKPTCELTGKNMELVDFANEKYAYSDFSVERNGKKEWLFLDEETKMLFADNAILSLGCNWYEHPLMISYKAAMDRVYNETFEFFKSLGYEHIRNSGKYRVIKSNNERVALFAHEGFGLVFLSTILDIPYPIVANHFSMCHTGITVINFEESDGYSFPRMLQLSSDSHLYREGLPTKYNNLLYF